MRADGLQTVDLYKYVGCVLALYVIPDYPFGQFLVFAGHFSDWTTFEKGPELLLLLLY